MFHSPGKHQALPFDNVNPSDQIVIKIQNEIIYLEYSLISMYMYIITQDDNKHIGTHGQQTYQLSIARTGHLSCPEMYHFKA